MEILTKNKQESSNIVPAKKNKEHSEKALVLDLQKKFIKNSIDFTSKNHTTLIKSIMDVYNVLESEIEYVNRKYKGTNCSSYIGFLIKGRRQGWGQNFYPSGGLEFEGEFVDGKKYGDSVKMYYPNESLCYQGI